MYDSKDNQIKCLERLDFESMMLKLDSKYFIFKTSVYFQNAKTKSRFDRECLMK